jgi:hypothetical protein
MTTTHVVAHSYQCCNIQYEFDFKHSALRCKV